MQVIFVSVRLVPGEVMHCADQVSISASTHAARSAVTWVSRERVERGFGQVDSFEVALRLTNLATYGNGSIK